MYINVLVVEDDDDDFLLLEELLLDYQDEFGLHHCRNYPEALQFLENEDVDACLIDYFIGEKTGIDIVRDAIKIGFQGPLILLTGANGSDNIDEEALIAGADDYISKDDLSPQLLKRTA